jgi:hypothetical protein
VLRADASFAERTRRGQARLSGRRGRSSWRPARSRTG